KILDIVEEYYTSFVGSKFCRYIGAEDSDKNHECYEWYLVNVSRDPGHIEPKEINKINVQRNDDVDRIISIFLQNQNIRTDETPGNPLAQTNETKESKNI